MICYTAIYGDYDPLKDHPDSPLVDEWICYTDDPELSHPDWTVIVEPPRFPHPRLAAKWRKCHPPGGDTLWVDGSVWIQDPDFFTIISDALHVQPMTMLPHPDRTCIYREVEASIGMQKYAGLEQRMIDQVMYYRAQGWKENAGLWASTVIGRRSSAQVGMMGAAWFTHCELFSYQDQLSLPVLLDRYGITPAPLPYTLTENPWFLWMGHHRND